jgi:hypothetical protein
VAFRTRLAAGLALIQFQLRARRNLANTGRNLAGCGYIPTVIIARPTREFFPPHLVIAEHVATKRRSPRTVTSAHARQVMEQSDAISAK